MQTNFKSSTHLFLKKYPINAYYFTYSQKATNTNNVITE